MLGWALLCFGAALAVFAAVCAVEASRQLGAILSEEDDR